jgi:hypothetical protein
MLEVPPTTSMTMTVLRVTLVSLRPPGETEHTVIGDKTMNSKIVGAFERWLITSGTVC